MTPLSFDALVRLIEEDRVPDLAQHLPSFQAHAASADINGRTLLHLAAHNQSGDALQWLLDNQIGKIDAPDNHGETPLMRAAWLGYKEAVAILLASGARLDTVSAVGGTPLHFAYAGGTPALSVVGDLLAAGANKEALDRNGNPPGQWAIQAEIRERGAALLAHHENRGRLSMPRKAS